MIQGVHASSVVFLDLHGVTGALARLGERLPGVDGSGHEISLGNATWVLRIGAVRAERHALFCGLHVAPIEQPNLPELKGVLHFQEVPGTPARKGVRATGRIKVTFEGSCVRLFASLPAGAPTDKVLHVANDHARRILDLVVNAIEGLAQTSPRTHSAVA
jgi:hypothetical protein